MDYLVQKSSPMEKLRALLKVRVIIGDKRENLRVCCIKEG